MPPALFASEADFVRRMAVHVRAGLSCDAAARAVLADDQRILRTLRDNPHVRAEAFDRMALKTWRRVRANAANQATPALAAAPSPGATPC